MSEGGTGGRLDVTRPSAGSPAAPVRGAEPCPLFRSFHISGNETGSTAAHWRGCPLTRPDELISLLIRTLTAPRGAARVVPYERNPV